MTVTAVLRLCAHFGRMCLTGHSECQWRGPEELSYKKGYLDNLDIR